MQAFFFLSCYSEEDMNWITENGFQRYIDKGEPLIIENKANEHLHILLEGSLQVSSKNVGHIAKLDRGQVVGEISFVDNRLPLATVKSQTSCTVFSLERNKIHQKIKKDPRFGCNFYRSMGLFLAHRLRESQKKDNKNQSFEEEIKGQINPELLKDLLKSGQRFFALLNNAPRKN